MKLAVLAVSGMVICSTLVAPATAGADVQVTVGENSELKGDTAAEDFTGPAQRRPLRTAEASSTADGSVGNLLKLVGLQFSTSTPTEIARIVTFVAGIVTQIALVVGKMAEQEKEPAE